MKEEEKVTLEGLSLYHYRSHRRKEEKRRHGSEGNGERPKEGETKIAPGHSSNIYQGSNI